MNQSPLDQMYGHLPPSTTPTDLVNALGKPAKDKPTTPEPFYRVFNADLSTGPVTFPNQNQPLPVPPDWWVVILTDNAARMMTITRSGGDDLTVPLPQDNSTAFRTFKIAFPGESKTITINARAGAVYATVIALRGYCPKDILP